ncbi:MAG: YidC/Oxa1 family membrane protein insertase [Candidatus Gracilibacteria bacterium]|nr:YidC/Oxa1 family membrane protein insertase [Candidatus Gracilibacteria bacterium]
MKKILDIVIIFLLVYLIINLFNTDTSIEPKQEIVVNSIEKEYTIPASVKIEVENNRTEELKFNTCSDFNLRVSGNNITPSDSFCSDVTLDAGESYVIDYSGVYDKFLSTGNYVVTANLADKEYITTFEVENKGAFTKLFTTLVYAPVYNLLIFLIETFSSSLGWAIVSVTIIIRLILLWPQHKMMVSQRRLQALQPKIKEIQEQYKGNHQMLGMKMMELYKKEKVNPMGSCGFLIIQMPILLVIYNVILYIKDESHYYYIYNFLKDFDISSISYSFYGLDLLGSGGVAGLVLGLSIGIIQFIQIKLSLINNKTNTGNLVLEKKKGASDYSAMMPDTETMNKFMLYGMPAMVAVFTYSFPAGIGIYWGISTLFMIFQQLTVNKIIKKSKQNTL